MLLASLAGAKDFLIVATGAWLRTSERAFKTSEMDNATESTFLQGSMEAWGVLGAWSMVSGWPVSFELTGCYQFSHSTPLRYFHQAWGDPINPSPPLEASFAEQRLGAGLRVARHKKADWSLGLEYRAEILELTGSDPYDPTHKVRTLQQRPWATGGLGYNFPGKWVKPYLGLALAVALSEENLINSTTTNPPPIRPEEQFLRSLAPNYEVGMAAGIRF